MRKENNPYEISFALKLFALPNNTPNRIVTPAAGTIKYLPVDSIR